jgi:hypothetical protein
VPADGMNLPQTRLRPRRTGNTRAEKARAQT